MNLFQLAFVAALNVAHSSSAEAIDFHWQEVNRTADGELITYIDPATIKRVGNSATVWLLLDRKTVVDLGKGALARSLGIRATYHCVDRTVAYGNIGGFDQPMGEGVLVYDENGSGVPEVVAPQSNDEAVMNAVCKSPK